MAAFCEPPPHIVSYFFIFLKEQEDVAAKGCLPGTVAVVGHERWRWVNIKTNSILEIFDHPSAHCACVIGRHCLYGSSVCKNARRWQ